MNLLQSIWNSFKGSVRGFDAPNQLAIGVVFGMLVGLLPKDSALPYAIAIAGLLSTGNIVCLLFSAIAFSFLSPVLDPVTHPIGLWVLTFDPFETFWSWLVQLPALGWARFENTVVTGSLCLGLLMAYPVFRSSLFCFQKFGASFYSFFANTKTVRWLVGETPNQLQKS